MSKKLPTGKFRCADKLSIYTEQAIKMYDENNDYGAVPEVDIDYPLMMRTKHKDLPFLPQRKKINKVHKLVTTLDDKKKKKKKSVVHIAALKQALNHGLKLKKRHRVIEFKQEEWLKPSIDKNTDLRKMTLFFKK